MPALDESRLTSGPEVLVYLAGADAPPQSCILLGIEQGKIHVRADKWIEPASQVTAEFARVTISGEVVYCTRKDTWYRTCISMISGEGEGRREPRLPVRLSGKVMTLSDSGSESAEGTIHDLSVSGMLLETTEYAAPGSMIFVETESNLIVGEVRHCRDRQNGRYEAGIVITDILSDMKLQRGAPGVVRKIRRKLAQAILGEQITSSRTIK